MSAFVFQVIHKDAGEVQVRFMKRVSENTYVWPNIEDQSNELLTSVVCALDDPDILNTREQYTFKDIAKVKANVTEQYKMC